ncbi:MAG TPA: LuxR C-terminal-related transcriptional regulator [Limnochordales bacterium]
MAGRGAAGNAATTLDDTLAESLSDRLRAWAAATSDAEVAPAPAWNPGPPGRESALAGLTPREREVALAVLDGMSNAEIARRLWVSEVTVKKHLSSIFAKTGVSSRTQLIKRMLMGSAPSVGTAAVK